MGKMFSGETSLSNGLPLSFILPVIFHNVMAKITRLFTLRLCMKQMFYNSVQWIMVTIKENNLKIFYLVIKKTSDLIKNFPIDEIFLSNCTKLVIAQTTSESTSNFSGFTDIFNLNIKNVLTF